METNVNCYVCGDFSLDDCVNCHRPVCGPHSKTLGDYVLCHECIAREEENE